MIIDLNTMNIYVHSINIIVKRSHRLKLRIVKHLSYIGLYTLV